jgi:hypothetical protein
MKSFDELYPFIWSGTAKAKLHTHIFGGVEIALDPALGLGCSSLHTVVCWNEEEAKTVVKSINERKCGLFVVPFGGDSMAAKKKPVRKAKKASKAAAKKPTKKGGRKRPSYSGL